MHILTLTSLFPNSVQPLNAIFVRNRMESFTRRFGHDWTVVAPVPYFPQLPFKVSRFYDEVARVPGYEDPWGYPVHHPRYLVTPKIGMRFYGTWMAAASRSLVREIHRKHPIDIIDGHYIYPDGTAAVQIGAELGIPVVLSARGTDLNLYPALPHIRPLIQKNLESCSHLICVCSELKSVALGLGTPAKKVTVIGNGVDASLFHPGDGGAARRRLGLPIAENIILSVGHMTERKGFHLIIESFAGMGRDGIKLVIAGDGPQRGELEGLVRKYSLKDRVLFPGAVANAQLPTWYQAADIFVLASSREGWPNAVCEAQAVGLPVVATRVWGIPEIITDSSLGILVEERSAEALKLALTKAIATKWDKDSISLKGRKRTWESVSDELTPIFRA